MSRKREILYPFFLECGQLANDAFWESIFEDLAYGKAPHGTYISKGFLTCSFRGKEFSYKLERKDPAVLYQDIYNLLTEKIGILSQKEKMQKKIDFHEVEKNLRETRQDWASIRKKNIRDTLYEKYVIEMKNKYNLSIKQCKYLLAILLVALTFKTITAKDVDYNDDRINEIRGIAFEPGKVILQRSLCGQPLPSDDSSDPIDDENGIEIVDQHNCKYKMSENWSRYIKMMLSH